MPPKPAASSKRKAPSKAGKGTALVAHHFLPVWTKPSAVIGDYIEIQGKEWQGCPTADKEK